MPGSALVQTAGQDSAGLPGSFFPGAPLGYLVPGARAGLFLVDYHPGTPSRRRTCRSMGCGFRQSIVTVRMTAGHALMGDRQQRKLRIVP